MIATEGPLLDVHHLRTDICTRNGYLRVVDDVSFSVARNEALGLVGESGSGKTMTALSVLRLLNPWKEHRISGSVLFGGVDLVTAKETALRRVRGNRIGFISQDAMASLDPLFNIASQMRESIALHLGLSGKSARRRALELLEEVGLQRPERILRSYPHQLSGGMRQRVVGAIAVAGNPDLIIADEPTSNLDATTQEDYLRLLARLRREHHLSILLISHDISIVERFCERTAVMYAGKIVEQGPTGTVLAGPAHPYTRALLRCVPSRVVDGERLAEIPGQPPSMAELPAGCRFAARCAYREARCETTDPPLLSIGGAHHSACLLADQVVRRSAGEGDGPWSDNRDARAEKSHADS